MHRMPYGSACKSAYVTRWPRGVSGDGVLLYMQHTAWRVVIKLVEHPPAAKDHTESQVVSYRRKCAEQSGRR